MVRSFAKVLANEEHGCAAVVDAVFFELDGQVLFGGGRGDLAAVNGWFANGFARGTTGPIGIRCAPPDAARNGRALWKAAPRWRKGGGTVEGCFGAWVKWALCWFLCRSL